MLYCLVHWEGLVLRAQALINLEVGLSAWKLASKRVISQGDSHLS